MPSLKEVSFKVTQRFKCPQCDINWGSTVNIPQDGKNCPESTTIEELLQKSLYASGSVLYGNIGIRDIVRDDKIKHLMQLRLQDCQGEIELECKPNHSSNRTCSDCMYATKKCFKRCCSAMELDNESQQTDYRLTKLIHSLDTGISSGESPHPTMNPFTATVEPLNEKVNAEPCDQPGPSPHPTPAPRRSIQRSFTDSSMCPSLGTGAQISTLPNSDTAPTVVLRTKSSRLNSLPIISPTATVKAVSVSKTTLSNSKTDVTSNKSLTTSTCTKTSPRASEDNASLVSYETPLPPDKPTLPQKTSVFSHTTRADAIRDALRTCGKNGCYAVVELAVKDGGHMRTPYIIICLQFEQGYRVVFETDTGEVFIHREKRFNSLKEMLSYYKKNKTKGGASLLSQLTHLDLVRYLSRTS